MLISRPTVMDETVNINVLGFDKVLNNGFTT